MNENKTDIAISVLCTQQDDIKFELCMNYKQFNRFIESLCVIIPHTMCLNDTYHSAIERLTFLPFMELYKLKNPDLMANFLKEKLKSKVSKTSVLVYHIETIFILQKLKSLFNETFLNENIEKLMKF